MNKIKIPTPVKVFSVVYIIIAIFMLVMVPTMQLVLRNSGESISNLKVMTQLFPITLLGVVLIVSISGLLKLKNWGKYATILVSGIYLIINVLTYTLPKFSGGNMITLIIIVVNVYTIWYLLTHPIEKW